MAWTDFALVTFTVQVVPEVESQPSHPLKTARRFGAAVRVTTVPKSKETAHVGPQLIWVGLAGLEVDVTVPSPTPRGLDLVTVTRNLCRVNVAVTDRAALTVAVQTTPETESHPTQLVILEPVAGVAVRVTTVPSGYALEQVLPQLIWVGLEGLEVDVIVPPPLPAFCADRVAITVKLVALVPVPTPVVTLTGPLVAPAGTVAWIAVSEVIVKSASAVLKITAVAPVKSTPRIVTLVPTGPLVGVKLVIVGAPTTLNTPALFAVPPGVVTLIGPVVAAAGTVAWIVVGEVTV